MNLSRRMALFACKFHLDGFTNVWLCTPFTLHDDTAQSSSVQLTGSPVICSTDRSKSFERDAITVQCDQGLLEVDIRCASFPSMGLHNWIGLVSALLRFAKIVCCEPNNHESTLKFSAAGSVFYALFRRVDTVSTINPKIINPMISPACPHGYHVWPILQNGTQIEHIWVQL